MLDCVKEPGGLRVTPEPLSRADVLSASEASELLGIPRSTLYDLARRGELPARRIGRRMVGPLAATVARPASDKRH
jgi:excisionase family DNA binding protein